MTCSTGTSCDAGFASYPFDAWDPITCVPFVSFENISNFCYDCCQDGKPAGAGGCNSGLTHSRSQNLFGGTIAPCNSLLPADVPTIGFGFDFLGAGIVNYSFDPPSSADLVDARGVCSLASPVSFAGASREPWPNSSPPSSRRSTIFVIHGREASCDADFDRLLDQSVYDRNQLTYCVEYDPQTGTPINSTPGAPGRKVRILSVLQDGTGEGPNACAGTPGGCSFDRTNPILEVSATTLSVEGVADALARAIVLVPTEGEITLIPSSQGGFVARALLHRHYDDLRWRGKKISRVVSLAHPYFGVLTDPSLVTGWGCSAGSSTFKGSTSFKNCHVSRWLWGWQNWLAGGGDSIDNLDFPQIQWSAIAGDSTLGSKSDALKNFFTDACIEIFGGVVNSNVAGDGTVPILSSLGVDEHDFFGIDVLDFDDAIEAPTCDHDAACLLKGAVSELGDGLLARSSARDAMQTLVFGGDDQVAVSDPAAVAALKVTDGLTLEAWILPGAAPQMTILSKGGEYRLEVASGLRWSLGGFQFDDIFSTNFVPPIDRWTHVALTYDASAGVVRSYANGELVHSEGGGGLLVDSDPTNNELRIGGHEDGSLPSMLGAIDDVRVWSRELTQVEIAAGMAGDPGAGDQTDLIAWWSFDEMSGDTLLDSSNSGFAASLTNFPERPWRWGAPRDIADGALYFDGVDDRVVVDDPASLSALEMTNALTVEAWVFPRGPGPAAGGAILSKEGEYQLTRLADGTVAFTLATATPGWSTRVTGILLPERTWTHVALVFDGAQARIYQDGVLAHTEAAVGPIGDFPSHGVEDEFWIGGRQFNLRSGSPQWFDGVVDEVRVWNRARSGAEIAADRFRVLDVAAATGLTGYWRFQERATDVVLDASGTYHGELGGGVGAAKPARTQVRALPEPDSWLMSAVAGGFLAALSWRRRAMHRAHVAAVQGADTRECQ